MPLPSPARLLARLRRDGLRHTLRYAVHRAYSEYWEFRFGVRSFGGHRLESEGIQNPDAVNYSPTSYLDFRRAMKGIALDPERDVFLDYGSGKGRVVILAATYPFRRVIGVELSPTLTEIARHNLGLARPKLRCKDIELITTDATAYATPDDVTVIFFFNPFGGQVMAKVLENIRRSLAAAPRKLTIICATPGPLEEALGPATWIVKQRGFMGLREHSIYVTP